MTAEAYSRGHPLRYTDDGWVYQDTGESISVVRPCARCGELPTPEGHDACLGHIEGVTAACCGHGVEEAYQMKEDESTCE